MIRGSPRPAQCEISTVVYAELKCARLKGISPPSLKVPRLVGSLGCLRVAKIPANGGSTGDSTVSISYSRSAGDPSVQVRG